MNIFGDYFQNGGANKEAKVAKKGKKKIVIKKKKKTAKPAKLDKCLEGSNADLNKSALREVYSEWNLPNRTSFVEWMNTIYSEPFNIRRGSKGNTQFPHQEFVTNYIQKNSPYRGLLLYHGLGAGKTASSVAITDGISHDRKIVIMLPASLRTNYESEIRRWGNILFKENVHYCFVKASAGSKEERILKERGIPVEWIRKTGVRSKKKRGAWMIDTKKKSRNTALTDAENREIRNQIDYLLSTKYSILHYNNTNTLIQQVYEFLGGHKRKGRGVKVGDTVYSSRDELKMLVHNTTIVNPEENPFNDKIVVVDEIHNLISMMIGSGFNGPLMYYLLMTARRVKYVFLSGTPMINYPYEVAILLNIIRGYSHTLQFSVRKGSTGSTVRKLEENLRMNIRSIDRVEYKKGKLYVTRNPRGFISSWNMGKYKGVLGDESHNELNIEDLEGVITEELRRNNWSVTGEPNVIKNTVFPEILQEAQKLPDTRSGLLNFKRGRENAIRNFESLFIKGIDGIQNGDLFMRRILGLVSYYKRVNRTDWFPTTLNPDGSIWNAEESGRQVKIKMSDWQLEKYTEVRDIERERDSRNRISNAQKRFQAEVEGQAKKSSSLYRILSRQHCNFVFPPHIERPRPHGTLILEDEEVDESLVDSTMEYTEALKDVINRLCRVHLYPRDHPFRKAIVKKLKDCVSPGPLEEDVVQALNYSLDELSPKFVKMLENMNNAPGLSFLYSQFRSVEGIEIFSKVLDASGYTRYTTKEASVGFYDMVEIVESRSKRGFHTGMVVDKKYVNSDKPYYKKLSAMIVEMEMDKHMNNVAVSELMKFQSKKCDPTPIVKNLKSENKRAKATLWKRVKGEISDIDETTFKADYKAITESPVEYKVKCIHADKQGWYKSEELNRSRYALWTGTEDPEEREEIRAVYNQIDNKMGNIIKILMITASGAEGISLMNVRGVHIMEPYWNRVRIEQVIGRAARIKSHVNLPKSAQNVTVFEYIVGLTAAQKKVASNIKNKDMGLTSDETLYKISDIKSKVLYGLLKLLKRSAIDCNFNEMDNRAGGDTHDCYQFLEGTEDPYSNTLNILDDERDEYKKRRVQKLSDKFITMEFLTPFKTKKRPELYAKFRIKLERGDELLNPLAIEGVRILYNYYTSDKIPIGFIYKGKHTFIKKEYMLKFHNGNLDRKKFLSKTAVSKMKITPREAKVLMKPWVEAEIARK